MSTPQLIVVSGPTATGKTRLSILLAKALGGEIVSADSMQVYRRMDIGTAKATAAERAQVPHHMIDVCEPWEDYSAYPHRRHRTVYRLAPLRPGFRRARGGGREPAPPALRGL